MHSVIQSTKELVELLPTYQNSPYLAVDTETNGLSINRQCIGVSFATSLNNSFYIPLLIYKNGELICPWKPDALEYIKTTIKRLLLQSKRLVMHNAVFDIHTLKNFLEIDVLPYIFCDTMLLAHTVHSEEGPMGLKQLAALLIDPNADKPQLDVKESVKLNGGSVTKDNFEMWKCDHLILGRYAAWDTAYTIRLFEILYPRVKEQGVEELWNSEVMPLLEVTYELNYNGIRVDIPYFQRLKAEVEQEIQQIEDGIYTELKDRVYGYELQRIYDDIKITPRSELGKALIEQYGKDYTIMDEQEQFILDWYKNKKQLNRIFNLDSNDDKAFLIYNVLGLPVTKTTKSGKPATDAKTLEQLCDEYKDSSPLIQQLLNRAANRKLLSTYIIPILDNQIDGKIYTGFNQTATVSGRYSSSRPINLQTLPRDDKRIKKGFIPDNGWVLIGDDYSSLEPRCFSVVAKEPKIQQIFINDLDFYSQIAIDMFNMSEVSANEQDTNFLKKIDPHKRQTVKQIALAIPYGAEGGRIAQLLGISYEEAKELVELYLSTYPNLRQWMQDSERQAIVHGFVKTLTGRVRRTQLLNTLYKKYNITRFTKQTMYDLVKVYKNVEGYEDGLDLYLACRNLLNNAKNAQIQGLAASVTNQAMIQFQKEKKQRNLQAKLILTVHDELIVTCPKLESMIVCNILKECMEHNSVTNMLNVPMVADPVVSELSLAEAK